MESLERRAFAGMIKFDAAIALLIFIPAWTLRFWQGWLYWSVFAAAVLAITEYFLRHDRALIERRLQVGPSAEHEIVQKRIQAFASVTLVATFVVAGLDHRRGWSPRIDARLELSADALVAIAFGMIFLVFRENSHAAGVVRVEPGQHVISTGPYAMVRHPMYSASSLLFLATPLALGSLWGYLPAIGLVGTLVVRLLDEERYLSEHLPGYREYVHQRKWRLVPGIW